MTNGEDTFYYCWSALDLSDKSSIEECCIKMKDLLTILCTEKVHTIKWYKSKKENDVEPDLWNGHRLSLSNRVFFNKPWPWVSKCSSIIANYVVITSQYITSQAWLYFLEMVTSKRRNHLKAKHFFCFQLWKCLLRPFLAMNLKSSIWKHRL